MMQQLVATKLVVLLCTVVQCIYSLDSIDTTEPIVREAPASLDSYGYFGFSVILHRTSENPQSFNDYLSSSRIVVSAPNGTADGASVSNTGVLYTCPVQQGSCSPLTGSGTGDDRFLYDTLGNANNEDKAKQFLGVSMDSSDDMFAVCAHRYIRISSGTRYPRGRCFFTTNRELEDFSGYEPCEGESFNRNQFGQCHAGSSVVFADTNVNTANSDSLTMIVGSFGSRTWQGNLFRRRADGSEDRTASGEGASSYNWQGYSMTKGHFISTTRQDIAVSAPRANNYFGRVNIFRNNNGLDLEGQTLAGTTQMGEYYGFSLAAVDLNGDGYDELLVGAPMYSPTGVPEAGQVYIYSNNQGNLEFFRLLSAPVNEEYTRFGHAITNLGDINGDGLDDVAISAPFGVGSGKVFIYYGSVADTITPAAQQIITGSDVTANLTVTSPRGFGYSLSSSFDVDGNGINDILIGAYETQQVFLLRSRAVASVSVSVTASPSIVNLDMLSCPLEGISYACFQLTACATFPSGSSFSPSTNLEFTLVVDRQNNELGLEKRVFFNNTDRSNTQTVSQTFSQGEQICVMETVYINNGISDRFNGFPTELSISSPAFTALSGDGNPNPTNLVSFPLVQSTGQSLTQVETFKDCDGLVCIPDLSLERINITYETSSGSVVSSFVAGEVANFNVWMRLRNLADDAFLTTISFSILTAQFEFIRVLPRDLLITCTSEVGNERTTLTCPIANPLTDGQMRTIGIRLRPTNGLRPSESPFIFDFSTTSLNDELNSTLANNNFQASVDVAESADIFLDRAIADPEQVSYTSNNATNITTPEDLGPPVTVSFVVRNAGPSTVPETMLRIFWPLREADSEFFYLYPSQIQRSSSNVVDCSEGNMINPLGLTIQSIDDGNDEEDEFSTGAGKKKRRRRRSISPLKRRKRGISKRQDLEAVDEVNDVLVNCRTNPEQCVEVVCVVIRQLGGEESVQLDVVSYLDERYFQSRTDRFTFVPYANISIVAETSSGIVQPEDHLSDETDVQIRVVTSVPPPRRRDNSVAPWIIIVPIVLALLFFITLGVILYFIGFFKRKNKEKKEEIAAQFLEAQQGGDAGFDDVPSSS